MWLLKEPVLLLAAQVYGLGRTAATRALWTDPTLAFLGANLGLSLAYFSFFFATQVGFRFVLMCVPMLALIAGAGLAPLVATARGRTAVVIVALAALAENVPYLGNHLAFTNAAVWPKREAYRLLTNANIDWGQNDDKIAGWLDERAFAAPPSIRTTPFPGENVFDLNYLAGVGRFRQHQWLREHVSPRAHLGHTYLWLSIDPATYERLLDESRHLRPSAVDARLCAGATPRVPSWTVARLAAGPGTHGRTDPLCDDAVAHRPRIDRGSGIGGAGTRRPAATRTVAAQGGPAGRYRLEPGTSALAAFASSGLRGHWAVRGGTATLALRRVPVEKGLIAEDPSVLRDLVGQLVPVGRPPCAGSAWPARPTAGHALDDPVREAPGPEVRLHGRRPRPSRSRARRRAWIPSSPTTAKVWQAGATKSRTPLRSAVFVMPSASN